MKSMDKAKIYNLIESLSDILYVSPEKLADAVVGGMTEFLDPIALFLKLKIPGMAQIERYSGDQERSQVLRDYEQKILDLNTDSVEFVTDSGERDILICTLIKYPQNCSGMIMALINRNHAFKNMGRQILELFKGGISLALTRRSAASLFDLARLTNNAFASLRRAGVEGILTIDLSDQENGFWVDAGGIQTTKITRDLGRLISAKDGTITSKMKDSLTGKMPSARDYAQMVLGSFEAAGHSFKCLFAGNFKSKDVVLSKFKSYLNDLEQPRGYDEILTAFDRLKQDHKLIVKGERVAAILETAVAINHEINNPLTAVLGNTQLILLQKEKLPEDVIAKINTIEKSAIRIREVTQKLMSVVEPVTTSYTNNLDMLDIDKSSTPPEE